jgi:hypothetical protein
MNQKSPSEYFSPEGLFMSNAVENKVAPALMTG